MKPLTKFKVTLGRLLGLRSEKDKTANRRAAAICAWQRKHQVKLVAFRQAQEQSTLGNAEFTQK